MLVGRRIRGRLKKEYLDDVKDDLRCMNLRGWRRMCNKRAEWKKVNEQAKTHTVFVTPEKGRKDMNVSCITCCMHIQYFLGFIL